MDLRSYAATEVAEHAAEGNLTRREALRRLALLGITGIADQGQITAKIVGGGVERHLADLRAGLDELGKRAPGVKLGMVGFCFGGGMTWSMLNAGEPRLAVAAPFYGPGVDGADFSKSKAAVLGVRRERRPGQRQP